MTNPTILLQGSVFKEECNKYVKKLAEFAVEYCGLKSSKNVNRVDLKKSLLNLTRGISLTGFVKSLSIQDKKHFLNFVSMECPVTCPNKKVIIPPIESMPCNVMKSCKKLRNFFGVPELQVCRGCIKKSRCRRYQQIERDIPDLSDLASVMIGVHSICKIHIDGSDLVVPEFAFRELPSVIKMLDALGKYFKDNPTVVEIPRGDEKACNRELKKRKKQKELEKLETLKEKIFNIPRGFNIMPKETTYMASFQRNLYNSLPKRKHKESDYVWVPDIGDTTIINRDNKLEKINNAKLESDAPFMNDSKDINVGKIEELGINDVEFRMEYSKPIGSEVNIVRYDVINDEFVQGIKINANGRVIIDLDKNLDENRSLPINGLEMYRIPSPQKLAMYEGFLKTLPSKTRSLSFLKRVPYNYKCQSSGETLRQPEDTTKEDLENLTDIALAINAK
ncbi:hypothetical protein BEWA_017990 [Theileria equi strain WA]|uniref:Uncharacterized protein n=1 Tax=Theileria equi strain WA TaxID=1537102 RepID=L0AUQ6_THEEQ|nr:hypothetical protein BEWA_017990 [Theileria equi strain WA]AFZ78958.1 hypothetical protein BEWA_017990 [Theileria equi strain WA]|eukprot:XP_004828624.1 hypothetical protein BEWA_017990 [Theileria equi strain WA]